MMAPGFFLLFDLSSTDTDRKQYMTRNRERGDIGKKEREKKNLCLSHRISKADAEDEEYSKDIRGPQTKSKKITGNRSESQAYTY